MLRRLRRPALLLLPALLMASLTACGDDDTAATHEGFEAVTISGDLGAEPKVEWKGEMSVDKVATRTLITGDGPVVEDGAQIVTQIWIGNGVTHKNPVNSHDSQAEVLTVDDKLSPVLADAMKGETIGSRVAVVASAADAFGEAGNPPLDIGNKDTVLFILDLASEVLDKPAGAEKNPPAWVPSLIIKKGLPKAFGFAGTPEPSDALRVATLIEGKGAPIKKGQLGVLNYLGQVYGGRLPFDESYSKGTPIAQPVGVGAFIKGWDKAMVGVTIGSRVVLAIPPKLGYGKEGNPQAGIKGTDTLYFLVDVLAAG